MHAVFVTRGSANNDMQTITTTLYGRKCNVALEGAFKQAALKRFARGAFIEKHSHIHGSAALDISERVGLGRLRACSRQETRPINRAHQAL